MKSYLRFLSRNKLYTAVEVVGLSIALGFIIILSSYIIDEMSIDREVKNKSDLWICHNQELGSSSQKLDKVFDTMPEIEDYCQFSNSGSNITIEMNGLSYGPKSLYVSSNFFDYMGYELVAGNSEELWKDSRSVVISETFAHNMFYGRHPVGRTLTYLDKDVNGQEFRNTLTVTGVFRNPDKSIVMGADIIMNMSEWPYLDAQGYDVENANLLRLAKGTDKEELCTKIYNEAADKGLILYQDKLARPLVMTPFNRMGLNVAKLETAPFINLTDKSMMDRFAIACLILLGFAILNYISLTIAFSRFRSKEMATRRILGTSGSALTFRNFLESFGLTAIAFSIGTATAVLIQDKASGILAKEIAIFSNPAEVIWSILLIVLLSIITALAPAIISSSGRPIDIVKGEARYKDKMILGKLFIFIQAAVSILCVSIALSYWLQTKKMIDTPLGYRTENVISIKGIPAGVPAGLESVSCVRKVGRTPGTPLDGAILKTTRSLADESLTMNLTMCDSSTLSILGIEIIELFKNERGRSDTYITESSAERIRNLCKAEGVSEDTIRDICDGVISDIRFGNHTGIYEGLTAIMVVENDRWRNYVVEVEGDISEAERSIKEHVYNIDVNSYFHGYNVHFNPEIKTMAELVEDSYQKEKDSITLIGIFALLCMMLTAMALIALSSHYARLNRYDTAVRKVFGISRKEVFRQTVWGFAAPVILGAAIAVPAAYMYIAHWLEAYPVRISNSPLIYASALAAVLIVTLASVSLQALRLMRTNPAEALKKE